jgi:hypothetical protein
MADVYSRGNNVATCIKKTAGTCAALKAVYPDGGDSDAVIKIELAKSDAAGTMPSIGITVEPITDTESGPVVFSGLIIGVDTSAWANKDELWVSATTAGDLTTTQPLGKPAIERVAQVLYSHATDGMLLVYNTGSIAHAKESDGALHASATTSVAGFMSAADKTKLAGVGPGGKVFLADQLDNPNSSDWAVNALAPASACPINAALTVRRFDDTTEEGVGFSLTIPSGVTNMKLTFKSYPIPAPPGGTRYVAPKLYSRGYPDNAARGSWSAGTTYSDIAIPNNQYTQYDSEEKTLSTLGLTAGRFYQFELTRVSPSGTNLTGDWALIELGVEFS